LTWSSINVIELDFEFVKYAMSGLVIANHSVNHCVWH